MVSSKTLCCECVRLPKHILKRRLAKLYMFAPFVACCKLQASGTPFNFQQSNYLLFTQEAYRILPRCENLSNSGFCAAKMDANNSTAVERGKECIQLVDEVTVRTCFRLEVKLD